MEPSANSWCVCWEYLVLWSGTQSIEVPFHLIGVSTTISRNEILGLGVPSDVAGFAISFFVEIFCPEYQLSLSLPYVSASRLRLRSLSAGSPAWAQRKVAYGKGPLSCPQLVGSPRWHTCEHTLIQRSSMWWIPTGIPCYITIYSTVPCRPIASHATPSPEGVYLTRGLGHFCMRVHRLQRRRGETMLR